MSRATASSLIALCLLSACSPGESAAPPSTPSVEPTAAAAPRLAAPSTAQQTFGAALDPSRELTALAEITASPERFKDQVVRTQGKIARVCQAMGCWMELQEDAQAAAVRVPMAGHAFFLPKDVAGRHATIEGRVALQELTPEARAHLAGEGAQAVASSLSISATGVVID